ncbi:carbohydrate kinase [Herbiconiux sp. CPCC 205763]|uniref:Carbohydrate kinase n=1 Tax=Herbiconiux aconitum TaxID=2970913 RepID=A0ABT2GQH0_9MICO|nr:carbohydrate kinase [Herbiconiux aconitum]MCS5718479.1 carbohydrate kinase [Herbiconiux aconitum]
MSHFRTSVVAIGESLIDVVKNPGADPVEHPGGSPMNIAFGLGRLGRRVTLITRIGEDARGEAIAAHLGSAGVELAPGSPTPEATSTATARLRPDGSADYSFDLRWSLPAGLSAAHPVLAAAGVVHAGSIGAFLEPGGTAVSQLLRELAARAAGGGTPLITLDPNIRPSIVPGHARVLERFGELAESAAVVKLSDEDADWLYPGADADDAADRILRLGPGLVAVTRGGEGALLATSSARLPVPGVAVTVADTIGAGDSFMSALIDRLAALLDEGIPAGSLREGIALEPTVLAQIGDFAVRSAAITVSRAGANPPTLAELGQRLVEAPGVA